MFLTDYPVELSPFAKRAPDKPGLIERFEAFCNGMEIGNGFSELNDPPSSGRGSRSSAGGRRRRR